MASELQALSFEETTFRYSPQTSVSGEAFCLTGYGASTANGGSDGTTLIDTTGIGNSGSADALNGRYMIEIMSGDNKGRWRRVINDDGAGTLTFEGSGFDQQIDSGVNFALWQTGEAGICVVDSSSSETNMVDAIRTEDADFWVGYWVVPLSGSLKGKKALITGQTNLGVFTLAAGLGAALSAGDVVGLYKYVEVGNFSMTPGQEYIERISNRANFSMGAGVVGARSGSLSFETECVGSGTLAGSGSEANRSVLSGLLTSALVEVLGTSTAIDDVGAAGDASTLKIDTATQENFDIGQVIGWNGNYRRITDKTDGGASADTLVVSPPFPGIPLNNDVIYATAMYRKSTTGVDIRGTDIEFDLDEIRYKFFGCKGNVELVDGPKALFRFTLNFIHWIRDKETVPVEVGDAYTNALPMLSHDKQCWLGTSQVDIEGFTVTPGLEFTEKSVSGRYGANGKVGQQLANQKAGGTFRTLVESGATIQLPADDVFQTQTSQALYNVWGSHADAMIVSLPAARLVQLPVSENFNRMVAEPRNFMGHDAGIFTDPTDGVVKVPDFSIHLT